jgi:hypothetical protein
VHEKYLARYFAGALLFVELVEGVDQFCWKRGGLAVVEEYREIVALVGLEAEISGREGLVSPGPAEC